MISDTAQMDRIIAVLEDRLPPEALSANDVLLLENKLMGAIIDKMATKSEMTFAEYDGPMMIN